MGGGGAADRSGFLAGAVFLEDIPRSAEEGIEFKAGTSFEEFVKDLRTIDAAIDSLDALSNAETKIPPKIHLRSPQIP